MTSSAIAVHKDYITAQLQVGDWHALGARSYRGSRDQFGPILGLTRLMASASECRRHLGDRGHIWVTVGKSVRTAAKYCKTIA